MTDKSKVASSGPRSPAQSIRVHPWASAVPLMEFIGHRLPVAPRLLGRCGAVADRLRPGLEVTESGRGFSVCQSLSVGISLVIIRLLENTCGFNLEKQVSA